MRRAGLALWPMLCLLPGTAPLAAEAPKPDRTVMVMAHRGCWEGGAPEVSVAAIRACAEIGPDIVEIDVQRTRDGALVLMHDETVDRMTDGHGTIAEMDLADIRKLRLRERDGGPAAALTGDPVPTLEEGLLAAKGRFIVNLHLKLPVEQAVTAVVERLGMAGQVTSWVSGRADDPKLAASPMRGRIGLIPVIQQCDGDCRADRLTAFASHRPTGFYIIPTEKISSEAGQAFVATMVAADRPGGAWIMVSTLFEADLLPREKRRETWRRLIASGVDLIMTDHPVEVLEIVGRAPPQGAENRRGPAFTAQKP